MQYRRQFTVLLMLLSFLSLSACSWMGETAGRAQAGMEEAVKDTREGYNKGYQEGKKK